MAQRIDGRFRMFDANLEMKDSGSVTTSSAATVNGVEKIIDVGANVEVFGDLVVDISAIEINNDNERYSIVLQGSNNNFLSDSVIEEIAVLNVGAKEVLTGNVDSTVGRYIVPFTNRRKDTLYQYLRIYTVVSGTVTTGINYTAFLTSR